MDGVVTMGGGSVIDCGKAVAFFVEQQAGTPGQSVLDRPAVVHVAVPTTYTPAVLTGAFTMTDPHTRTKAMTGTLTSAPTAVVYDPDLLVALGPATVAGTALDALAAAIGGTHRAGRSPETEALAHAAAARIVGALPLLIDVPDEDLLRAELLQGAALAARVLQRNRSRAPPGARAAGRWADGGATRRRLRHPPAPHRGPRGRRGSGPFGRLAEGQGGDDVAVVVTELLERVGLPAGLVAARHRAGRPGRRGSHVPGPPRTHRGHRACPVDRGRGGRPAGRRPLTPTAEARPRRQTRAKCVISAPWMARW